MVDNQQNHYDVICVGAGIANISLALSLIDTDKKVLIIEKGNTIENRHCPKNSSGKCTNCKSCQITTGFGGAGCFSDCKLTYSPYIGGELIKYVGSDKYNELLSKADKMFTDYGGKQEYFFNEEYANNLQYECSKYGVKLIKGKVRHLGTDGSYSVMSNIFSKLLSSSNITVMCNTDVESINFNLKIVYAKDRKQSYQFYGNTISIAVGRYGSEWLRKLCADYKIKLLNSSVDIGVRVECPRAITDSVTNNLYEFKLVNHSTSDNAVRTFCVNPGGFVTQENYDTDSSKLVCVNGHSYSDNKSLTTNFALLVSCNFTEPFNQPIEYAKSIAKMCNMLADGKPMVQRLIDLKNKKRSTNSRMQRLIFEPTLKNAEPGDLRYALPANVIDSIIETVDTLNNIMPGLSGKDTIFYAPEIKFYSSKIELNGKLQNDGFKDIYFLGDSSGVTHGIMQSAMSGIYTAENILNGV